MLSCVGNIWRLVLVVELLVGISELENREPETPRMQNSKWGTSFPSTFTFALRGL